MGDNGDDAAKYEAMAAELNQEDAELGVDREPISFNRPAEIEAYNPERHGVPEPPARQGYDRADQHQRHELPDMMDDPVAHFDGRVRQMEGYANHQAQIDAGRNIRDFVVQAENAAREETRGDYDEAVAFLEQAARDMIERQYPDGPWVDTLAHQYDLQNAAHLRETVLEKHRQSVIHQAITHGQNPAALYYQHAIAAGYKPQIAFTKSQMNKLLDAAEKGGAEFDKAWERYAAAERNAEQNRRARR